MKKDWVLITWLICGLTLDIIVFLTISYAVFILNFSAWWFLLLIIASKPTLFKVLSKKYNISKD